MSYSLEILDVKARRFMSSDGLILGPNEAINSINIDQTTGDFVVTQPYFPEKGRVAIYCRKPNHSRNLPLFFDELLGYGKFSFPLDARFDYIRNLIYVADTGNQKVLSFNLTNFRLQNSIEGLYLSHSIVPETNRGGFFVKSFASNTQGLISFYDSSFSLLHTITFLCDINLENVEGDFSVELINFLPSHKSMCYDHVRSRLWWVANSTLYMMDILNKQVIENLLSNNYMGLYSVEVDLISGNVFVIAKKYDNNFFILKIDRNNSGVSICESFISETLT